MINNNEETLLDILQTLRTKGYIEDYNLKSDCIERQDGNVVLSHDEFHIDQIIRLEGQTDPAEELIVYAISSDKTGSKGILLNAYGMYAEPLTEEMMAKLR